MAGPGLPPSWSGEEGKGESGFISKERRRRERERYPHSLSFFLVFPLIYIYPLSVFPSFLSFSLLLGFMAAIPLGLEPAICRNLPLPPCFSLFPWLTIADGGRYGGGGCCPVFCLEKRGEVPEEEERERFFSLSSFLFLISLHLSLSTIPS